VYGLKSVALYVFDVFNIDTGRYLFPSDARKFAENLGLQYVPLIADSVPLKDILPVDKALNDANRKSSLASIMSEGIIYKSNSDAAGYSFKAISNDYLVKPGKRV
jgi:ATP-dependent RNA circularization protein (DNA/RNA ligase family)